MNPLRSLCLVAACLLAVASGSPSLKKNFARNSIGNSLKPTEWFPVGELESIPALDEISFQQLQSLSMEQGADLVDKLYHLTQMNRDMTPAFLPSPSDIPVYFYTPNGQKQVVNLNQLVATANQQQNFGDQEVTIFITGLPQSIPSVNKANKNLVQAYMQMYYGQQKPVNWANNGNNNNNNNYNDNDNDNNNNNNNNNDNDDEDYSQGWQSQGPYAGNLIVIDLGATITNFQRFATLDVDKTGVMIGNVLVQLTKEADVPQEIIYIVAQGIAAHVAGAAGRQYIRKTGNSLRRITALDPSKIYAKKPNTLPGLARGNADFVDAIHTSAYGIGTPARVGDADFYPNGPSVGVPGADNIIEASMRATRYFAESVRPGNERNFPAVAAESLQQYNNNNGYGKRVYMGIDAEFDLEGDYILKVNSKSPFGKGAPAHKQNTYHGIHQWSGIQSQDYN